MSEYLNNIEGFIDSLSYQQQLFGVRVRDVTVKVLAKGFIDSSTLQLLDGKPVTTIECDGPLDKSKILTTLTKVVQDYDDNRGIHRTGNIAVALICAFSYQTSDRPGRPSLATEIPLWKNPDDEFINIALDYNKL